MRSTPERCAQGKIINVSVSETTMRRAGMLDPAIMGPPIRWLASADSDGVTDCSVVATEFAKGVRPTGF